MRPIVLFDGFCNLCNGAVTFVLEHEADSTLRFGSLSSEIGAKMLADKWPTGEEVPDSIIVVDSDRVYVKSDAALFIAGYLRSPWKYLKHFKWVPRFLRDAIYDLIARNRYSVFGRRDSCMVPQPEYTSRFVDS